VKCHPKIKTQRLSPAQSKVGDYIKVEKYSKDTRERKGENIIPESF